MIELSCTCGKKIKVPDTMAGKKGKCPGCGSVLEIGAAPPPPPPAAKKDDLLLELDEPRAKKEVPMEALIPPSHELPVEGPGKKKPARVSNDDLIGHDDEPKKNRTKPPKSADGSAGKIACPKCGEMYSADTLFCMKCKVDMSTGKAIAGLTGTGAKSTRGGEAFDLEVPFWKLSLMMIYKPHKVIPYFPALLERKDIKMGMIGLYLASFIAVFIGTGSVAKKIEGKVVKIADPAEEAVKLEQKAGTFEMKAPFEWTASGSGGVELVDGKPFECRVTEPRGPVDAGDTITIKFSFCESKRGKGIEGDAYVVSTEEFGGEPDGFWEPARPVGQPGDYEAGIDTKIEAGSSYKILLYPKGSNLEDRRVKPRASVNVAWPSKPGWGLKTMEEHWGATSKKTVEEEVARREKKKGLLRAPGSWQRAFDMATGRVGPLDAFHWKVDNAISEVEAGKTFLLTINLVSEKDQQPGDPLDVDVYYTAYGHYEDATDDESDAPGKMPQAKVLSTGNYQMEFVAAASRQTNIEVMLLPKGQKFHYDSIGGRFSLSIPSRAGWARPAVEAEFKKAQKELEEYKPSTVTGKTVKALKGGMVYMGPILENLLGLLLASVIFMGAARMFGGGGSFVTIVFTLAYLQAYVNMATISFAFVSLESGLIVLLVLIFYALILKWVALMKVFDLDMTGTLLTSIVAGGAQFAANFVITLMFGSQSSIGG